MNTVKISNKKTTLMVAHRGVSGLETENTIAAFIAAGNRSHYGIETDMHMTKDGYFVVCHDSSLARVSGVELVIEDSTLKEVQSVALMDKDGTVGRVDLRVPRLEDYIKICRRYEKVAVLELKGAYTDEQTERFIEIIRSLDYLDKTVFIAFDYDNLLKVRKILPSQPAQFLTSAEITDELIERLKADKLDLDAYYKTLSEEVINKLHKVGIKVNAWTVDNPETAEKLSSYGIDFITSNILE